jgi:uncharacterized membrane protein
MTKLYWTLSVGLVVASWAVAAWLYPQLPEKIPTHWNIHGKIDGYGPKSTIFILPAVMVGELILFALLPALSPKHFEVDASRSTYLYVMTLAIGVMAYIHGVVLYAVASGRKIDMTRALFAGLFLFLALLGNVMGRIKRNFYIGVRVPWTLASERVWNDTHRVAAWLMVGCGLAGFVMVIAGLPVAASFAVFAVAVVGSIGYAFVHYKQLERQGAL